MNNLSTCCKSKELSVAGKVVLSTLFGLTGLAALIGNALVLWLIARKRTLRTISNFFLSSLAAADFLVGLVINLVWILIRCLGYNADNYLQTYSKAIDYLWIHTTVATAFNLCCVTLDRHVAIFYSLRYGRNHHLHKMLRVDCHNLVYVLGSPLLEVLGRRCNRFINIIYFFYNHNCIDTDDYHHTVLYSDFKSRFSAVQANNCQYIPESGRRENKKKELQGCQDNQHCGRAVCRLLVAKSNYLFRVLF